MKKKMIACDEETRAQKESITREMITDEHGKFDTWKVRELLEKGVRLQEMPLKVAVYSSPSDNFNSHEIEIMFKYCKKYIERANWTLAEEYGECNISQNHDTLTNTIEEVIADINKGKIDLIVTPEVKFISDDIEVLHKIVEMIEDKNAGIYFVTDNISTLEIDMGQMLIMSKAVLEYEKYLSNRRKELYKI